MLIILIMFKADSIFLAVYFNNVMLTFKEIVVATLRSSHKNCSKKKSVLKICIVNPFNKNTIALTFTEIWEQFGIISA